MTPPRFTRVVPSAPVGRLSRVALAPGASPAVNRSSGDRASCASAGEERSSARFTALLGAFRDSGGTAHGHHLACLLKDHHRGDYVSLARLLVAGQLFSFEWREIRWIPMFQLDPRDLSLKQGLSQVLAAFSGAQSGWHLANWFTRNNDWLMGQRPVDVLDDDLAAVLNAARADCPTVAA